MLWEYQLKIIGDKKFSLRKNEKVIPNLGNKKEKS